MTLKQQLMNKIGFLKWVELSRESIMELSFYEYPGRVFLSPDVHSLHIVWTINESRAIQHEVADYPDSGVTLRDFLEDEIMDDAWDTLEDVDDNEVYEWLSTHATVTADTVNVVTLADLS